MKRPPHFWWWLFVGFNGNAGIANLISWYMLLDIFFAIVFGFALEFDLTIAAKSVLFPLASIFVGIALSWSANVYSIIQTEEISGFANHIDGGLAEYVYPFLLGIIIIMSTIVVWSICALDINLSLLTHNELVFLRKTGGMAMFFLLSMSIRTSWQMVNLIVSMILFGNAARQARAAAQRKKTAT